MFAVPTIVVCMLGLEMGRMSSGLSGCLFDQSSFNLVLNICQVRQVICRGLPPAPRRRGVSAASGGLKPRRYLSFLVSIGKLIP